MIYLFSFFSSVAFAVLYNVRGRMVFTTAIGGAFCKMAFDLFTYLDIGIEYFFATVALSLYAEVMARVEKAPVMLYIIIGMLQIVPGTGVYNTMASIFFGKMSEVGFYASQTLQASGEIALGVVLVATVSRMIKIRKFPVLQQFKDQKHQPRMR